MLAFVSLFILASLCLAPVADSRTEGARKVADKASESCPCQTIVAAVFALIAAAYIYYRYTAPRESPRSLSYVFDLKKQSVVLPGDERIHISSWGNPNEYKAGIEFESKTLYENFLHGIKASGDGKCLGWRPTPKEDYTWISYSEVLKRAHSFGSGLLNIGLSKGTETFIGIYAQNCAEWDIAMLGAMAYSIGVVPLYDTLGADSCTFIINQGEISVVLCDTAAKASALVKAKSDTPSLKFVIVTNEAQLTPELREQAQQAGIMLDSFANVSRKGQDDIQPTSPPKPDDLYMICYTSGTTGTPKGIMVTHKNVIAITASIVEIMKRSEMQLQPSDTLISYLPLAHMFEQFAHVLAFYIGAKIGYFQGNVRLLADDMKKLKPTYLPVVPRILNRVYDKVQSQIGHNKIKRALLNMAYNSKLEEQRKGIYSRNSIWDRLVFNKIREEFGGNIKFVVTASAPVSAEVLNFCRVAIGCPILECYGQTECTAGITACLPGDFTGGHVGGPMPCAHIKLEDVPELNYYAKNDTGEILIRGPMLMKGYFKDPEKTAETIQSDGWLHTGDIGRWLPTGALQIIDRKKHIFKLAQGEYVAPEKIENVYVRCPLISQIYVDGNSVERFLVAIVVPDDYELILYANDHLKDVVGEKSPDGRSQSENIGELIQNPRVQAAILAEMTKVGKENKLSSIEQVKAIHVTTDRFSVENGLITPTLKNKRPALHQKFAPIIDKLYQTTKIGGE